MKGLGVVTFADDVESGAVGTHGYRGRGRRHYDVS